MLDLAWGLRFLSPGQGKTRALQVRFDSQQLCISSAYSRTVRKGWALLRLLHGTTESKGDKGILTAPHAQPKPFLFSQTQLTAVEQSD